MTLDYITNSIDNKITKNNKKVIYTYYELKCEENLSEEEKKYFIDMAKVRLENLGYSVYLTGEIYSENKEIKIVEINEEIVAIKKEESNNESKRQNTRTKHKKAKYIR
ncbi:MAG: hypothetical protein IJE59_02985 [Clostridia bacterium]|nr:hypothetical protein [Clostridia bacterium]